jgi:hypothetical protein
MSSYLGTDLLFLSGDLLHLFFVGFNGLRKQTPGVDLEEFVARDVEIVRALSRATAYHSPGGRGLVPRRRLHIHFDAVQRDLQHIVD